MQKRFSPPISPQDHTDPLLKSSIDQKDLLFGMEDFTFQLEPPSPPPIIHPLFDANEQLCFDNFLNLVSVGPSETTSDNSFVSQLSSSLKTPIVPSHENHFKTILPSLISIQTAYPLRESNIIPASNLTRQREKCVLTEEQKRANHIASEKKRRLNLKNGFNRLQEIVPGCPQRGHSASKANILFHAAGYIEQTLSENMFLAQLKHQILIKHSLMTTHNNNK